jgi:hypothetical protein
MGLERFALFSKNELVLNPGLKEYFETLQILQILA